jgi:glycosyltransferase 2 family protein
MRALRLLLALLISAVFLFLAFRGVNFSAVGEALRSAAYWWLAPAVGLIVVSLYIRAVRWRMLFWPQTGIGYGNVFGSMNAGYLVNTVLPFRLGEVVRCVLLARIEPKVRTAHALSTVVVERVLDMLATIIVLAALIPFVQLPEASRLPLAVASTLAVGALVVIIVAGAARGLTNRIARTITARLPRRWGERIEAMLDSFLEGFAVLSNLGLALRLTVLSFVIWLLIAAGLWSVLFAFHLTLPPTAPMFALALVSLSFILPSSPGHIGVYHAAASQALVIGFGVDPTTAFSFALLGHLAGFAPPALLGAWFIWRSGLSLGRLMSFGRQAEPAAVTPPAEALRSR